jgi:hypothetical protein
MASGFQCGFVGLTDAASGPASAAVSPNLRVKATLGYIATLADVLTFSGASVAGNWVMPATRCLVGNIPAITASSAGIAYSALGVPTGPLSMKSPDTKASGT